MDIRQKYYIDEPITPYGQVYWQLKRGMNDLKQATRRARDQLVKNLAPFRYFPTPQAPNIWVNKTKCAKFCVCVDHFGVNYFSETDFSRLISEL